MMRVDWGRVERKSAYILEQVRNLTGLTQRLTKDEILHDPWIYAGVKYALHTAIEAIIELAYHVAARGFAHAPSDARDALHCLCQQGVISTGDYETYSSMVGLRNRLVHGYDEVDPDRLYQIITTELGDLNRFVQQVNALR